MPRSAATSSKLWPGVRSVPGRAGAFCRKRSMRDIDVLGRDLDRPGDPAGALLGEQRRHRAKPDRLSALIDQALACRQSAPGVGAEVHRVGWPPPDEPASPSARLPRRSDRVMIPGIDRGLARPPVLTVTGRGRDTSGRWNPCPLILLPCPSTGESLGGEASRQDAARPGVQCSGAPQESAKAGQKEPIR